MKKKLLIMFLAIVAAFCLVLGLSACGASSCNGCNGTRPEQNGGEHTPDDGSGNEQKPDDGSDDNQTPDDGNKEEHKHSYEIADTIAATCTEEGVITYTCSCGDSYTEAIAPMGHTADEAVTENKISATCTENGSYESVVYCLVCGEELSRDTVTVNALGHKPVTDAAKEPTCTETGLTEGSHCSVCGEILVKQETVAALGHKAVTDAAKAPTCTQSGLTAGSHCSVCGEILVKQEVVAALGHKPVTDAAKEPTCTQSGLTAGSHCSVCGVVIVPQTVINATGHDYNSEIIKEATCTEEGVKTYTCTLCGDSYTVPLPAIGHSYTFEVTKEATCEETGLITYTCENCEESYTITTVSEHNYELAETVAATCTTDGYQRYRCSVCNSEYFIMISAENGHDYVGVVTKQATMEEEGIMTYTCSVCNDSYTVTIAKLNGGDGSVLLIQDRLPWTSNNNTIILNYLTTEGYISGYDIATSSQVANMDISNYTIIYIANDQTTATYNQLATVSAKLTEFAESGGVLIYGVCDNGWAGGNISYTLPGGVTKSNYYSFNNYIVDDNHDILTGVLTGGIKITNSMLYSTYSSHTAFYNLPEDSNIILQDAHGNPTLVEYPLGGGFAILSGLTWEYTYERTFVNGTSFAKEIYDDLFIYALSLVNGCEHEYGEGTVVTPTCTEQGYTYYVCALCGRIYRTQYTQPIEHDYGEWIEGTEATTCGETGTLGHYTCLNCGKYFDEDYVEIEDITFRGTDHYHSVLGYMSEWYADKVVEFNREYFRTIANMVPTCGGSHFLVYFICEECYEVILVEAYANHDYGDWIEGEAATCDETGTLGHYKCLNCGKYFDENYVEIESIKIPALGHNYVDGFCTRCGVALETEAVPDDEVAYDFNPVWANSSEFSSKVTLIEKETVTIENAMAYNTFVLGGVEIGWHEITVTFVFHTDDTVDVTFANAGNPNTYTGTYEAWRIMNFNNFIIQLDPFHGGENPDGSTFPDIEWSTGEDANEGGAQIFFDIFYWISKGGKIVLAHEMDVDGYSFWVDPEG